MSKEILKRTLEEVKTADNYIWSLYFFSIDNRSKSNPFKASKGKFKDPNYLLNYGRGLASSVLKYQVEKTGIVEEYHGENPKISCDKLSVTSELISQAWKNLETAVINSDTDIEGKVKGYILCAEPNEEIPEKKSIMFIKKANPIIEIQNKKSVIFTLDKDDNLDNFSKKTYKFYLTTDCIVVGDTLYAFNLNFEEVFSLDKTLSKIKNENIKTLINKEIFCSSCNSNKYLNSLSSKSYTKFDSDRLLKIENKEGIKKIAKELKLELNSDNKIILNDKSEAAKLVKYLSLKSIKEAGTGYLYEVSGSIKRSEG